MMSEISCDICSLPYSQEVIPRSLPTCGHSICSGCLISLLNNSKLCPVCRSVLPFNDETKYPVNYPLLKMCQRSDVVLKVKDLKNKAKKLKIDDVASTSVLECLSKEQEILEHAKAEAEIKMEKLEHVKANITLKRDMIDLLARHTQTDDIVAKIESVCVDHKKNKDELIQLIQKDVKFDDIPSLKETLQEMEVSLNEMSKINYSFIHDIKKIYEYVRGGVKVEAVGSVEGEEKIWRLSYEGDKLFLHHFAESASKDPSAVSLQFDEVVKQMEEGGNLSPFVDFEFKEKSEKWRFFLRLSEDEGLKEVRDYFVRLVTGQEGKEGGYRGGGGVIYNKGFYVGPPENIRKKLGEKYESLFNRTEDAADVADAEWKMYLYNDGVFGIFSSRPDWPPSRLIGKLPPEEGDKVKEMRKYLLYDYFNVVDYYDFNVVDCGVAVKVN